MSDELVKRLRAVDHLNLEDCFCQSSLYDQAADHIEALTAERDDALECNEQFFVYNQFLKKRVEKAEAERDRLRAALEDIADHDTGATAGLAYTAKIALKGETP